MKLSWQRRSFWTVGIGTGVMTLIVFRRLGAASSSAARRLSSPAFAAWSDGKNPMFMRRQSCLLHSISVSSLDTSAGNQTVPSSSSHSGRTDDDEERQQLDDAMLYNPWNNTNNDESRRRRRNNKARFRQHVNPLARRFQQPAILSPDWPRDVLEDLSLPLHLDIGCGKGGFLLEMAQANPKANYVGLEIRPSVFQYALDRVGKRGLTGRLAFVGCNANVDLERLLALHQEAGGRLQTVTIQFPDPHFKASHAKRRVVTPTLVRTLAKFLPRDAIVFLQSDVQDVFDDMRLRFREHARYFRDEIEDTAEYMRDNPMGIQTEREMSVLKQDLPVYRTVLRRTGTSIVHE